MSGTAVVPAPGLWNDFAAFRLYVAARLRLIARDPVALCVLAFAGVASVALWNFWLGIHPAFSHRYPWPGGPVVYDGPAPTAFQLAFYRPAFVAVVAQVLWAALVAWATAREVAQGRGAFARPLPALPVGPRARILADALVATCVAAAARLLLLALAFGGAGLGWILFGHDARFAVFADLGWLFARVQPSGLALTVAAYGSAMVVSTLLGTLLVLPLVVALATTTRLDWRGLARPVAATVVAFAGLAVGVTAHLVPAAVLCLAVCGLLLVRLDSGERLLSNTAPPALRFRASPGPWAQLRRDAWLGSLAASGRFLALAVSLPLLPAIAIRTHVLGWAEAEPVLARGLAFTAALVQWLILMAFPFRPFGLALVPAGRGRPGALFSGAFQRSWSTLPVPRERVVRVVYAHALVGSGLAWLVLAIQAALLGARSGLMLYELPGVFVLAGLAVCETVGDRRLGLLAVASLIAFQFGVPFAHAAGTLLEPLPPLGSESVRLTVAGCTTALVGALPPLVHLRGRTGVLVRSV